MSNDRLNKVSEKLDELISKSTQLLAETQALILRLEAVERVMEIEREERAKEGKVP